jgi:DNA-directed RNA polymerase subunit RPC12/RpoP
MDFKISSGSGKTGRCPECGHKLLNMIRDGIRMTVCVCGWEQELKSYDKNIVDTKNINIS